MLDAIPVGERDLMQAFNKGVSVRFMFKAVFGGFAVLANVKSLLVSVTTKFAMGTLCIICEAEYT